MPTLSSLDLGNQPDRVFLVDSSYPRTDLVVECTGGPA